MSGLDFVPNSPHPLNLLLTEVAQNDFKVNYFYIHINGNPFSAYFNRMDNVRQLTVLCNYTHYSLFCISSPINYLINNILCVEVKLPACSL